MKRLVPIVALMMVAAAIAVPGALTAPAANPAGLPALSTLEPGGFRDIAQDLKVNVVFVGYEPGAGNRAIDEDAFRGELASTYRAINRFPSFYTGNEFLGLTFDYDYNLVYADAAFEDAFFGYLGSIADPQPRTVFQDAYNAQVNATGAVTDNHSIDAASVEQWLADNTETMLDVDTSEYTVFFVNWYDRPDFKYHVYTKTGEPDPDTGTDFGLRDTRKLIAWGGTTPDDEESGLGSLHRIWFYDLSAGPEAWTDNWNVDDDLGYRMPPVWEYGNTSGYRPFDDLSGDLGKVTRYVALDLLFTTSPLYKPALSPPLLPEDIELDVNVYQMDPGADGTDFIDTALLNSELAELQPLNSFSTEITSQAPGSRFLKMYDCFFNDTSCFGNRLFGIAFADPFLYHQDHLMQFLEGDGDYEIPVFAYNTTDELFTCCLGYADDDWATGTQSFVFAFDSPSVRTVSGYGFTTTLIHEVGHHLGLSHPHDGFDYEANVDFGPSGDFYFAWSGDESNSMMSYIDLNWDFSQFDRDNMARYLTSVYLNQANAILGSIAKSPRAGNASSLVQSADGHAGTALTAYAAMDYADAALQAKSAYDDIIAAAAVANVKVEPQNWTADYKSKGRSPKFVDPVDYGHRFDTR